MAGFWESCLQRFEQELPAQQFNTWIKPLRLEGESTAQEKGLQLLAPNGFILKWVREKFLHQIEAQAQEFFAAPVSINLLIGNQGATPGKRPSAATSRNESSPHDDHAEATENSLPAQSGSGRRARGGRTG